MRQRLKISLSLLISLVLCGGFAVFSFSSLFDVVETTFFQPRIEAERKGQLKNLADRVSRYDRDNIERYQPAVQEPFVARAFQESNQQAQEDIFNRQIFFGKLLDDFPNIQLIRFLGSEGKRIHFSTADSDIESQDRQRRKYLDYDRTGETIEAPLLLAQAGEPPRLILDGAEQRFIYSFPVIEEGDYRGVVLFYLSKRDLLEYLLRFPDLDVRELSVVGQRGIVINIPIRDLEAVQTELIGIWAKGTSLESVYQEAVVLEVGDQGAQDGQTVSRRDSYNLLSVNAGNFGTLSLLIPYSVFQLQPIMKIVVIAAIFLTVFLIFYFILNLRQDPVLILSQRIKRLQLEILREFIEGRERLDWKIWQDKLEGNRGELKSRIKRGIGRIPTAKEAELDGMIDRSWDEIISIIETRVGGPQPETPDVRHIEALLQRALEGAQLTVRAPVVEKPKVAAAKRAGIVVEEIGVDEVIEPGQVIPSRETQELEEAEAVEEAEEIEEAEAVEEAEELEEAEAVEEVEAAPLEEAEAVEEVEAAPLEEAEAVEEVEAAPLEEAEELEEAEAVEEAEEIEEAEAVGEAEELEEAEAVEEVEAAPLEEAEAFEEADELGEAEALAELDVPVFLEGEEQETVEELEGVKEIIPLPPLPQEKLEELPSAEEVQKTVSPPQEPAAVAEVATADQEQPVEELEVAEDETAPIESILSAGGELIMEAIPGQEPARQLSPEEIEKIQQLDEKKQLEELLESNVIQIYSLEAIEAIIMEQRSSVVMENGVYRIKEEIVSGAEVKSGRRGLMALAKATLSEPVKITAGLESGIGALLGEESILDLETEIGQIRERSTEIDYSSLRKSKKISFFEDGLDYDEYLKAYRAGKTETDRLRSLVEFSGKLKAVNAAVFSSENGKYSLVLKVGLNDPGFEVFFSPGEPFIEMFVEPRHTVYIGENIEKIKALAKKMHPEDLKYMQAAIIFPALFRGHRSFLYLGLPVQWDFDIEDIITRLDIY